VSYPGSSLRFRAPAGDPTRAHVLCLGGTETFGRFVENPIPNLLSDLIETPVINMGVAGGGLDVVLNDGAIAMARVRDQRDRAADPGRPEPEQPALHGAPPSQRPVPARLRHPAHDLS
jgi:hypothetical protein